MAKTKEETPNKFDSPATRDSVKMHIRVNFQNRHRNRGRYYQLFHRDGGHFTYGTRERWSNKNTMLNTAANALSWHVGLPNDYQDRDERNAFVKLVLKQMIEEGELQIREV